MPNSHMEGGVLLHAGPRAKSGAPEVIRLPAPDLSGGKPLMQALKDRHTSREFSNKAVPLNVMSDLLWAAFGVNREHTGGRTAPSAHEWHAIEIYVATAEGLYLYEARAHDLRLVLDDDIRIKTGLQSFVADGSLPLSYCTDDRVGILYEGTDPVEVLTDYHVDPTTGPAAYRVELDGGSVVETRLAPGRIA